MGRITDDKYHSSFAERLRAILAQKKMSQAELAKAAGLSEQTITNYVQGDRRPNTDIVVKIAKALSVSSDYLLGLQDVTSGNLDIQYIHRTLGLSEETIIFMQSEMDRLCELTNTDSVDEALDKQRQVRDFITENKTTQEERIAFAQKIGLAESVQWALNGKTFKFKGEQILFAIESIVPSCLAINTLMDDKRFFVPVMGKRHPSCIIEALWQIFEHEKIKPDQFYFLSRGSERDLRDTGIRHSTILTDGKGDWKMDSRVMYSFYLLDLQRALNDHGIKMKAQYLMEKKKK